MMNSIFATKYCWGVFSNDFEEAKQKIKGVIEYNTHTKFEGKRLIPFDDCNMESVNERDEFVSKLLDRKEFYADDFPIGYMYCPSVREMTSKDVIGAEIEHIKSSTPVRFVTAYKITTFSGISETFFDKKEAIKAAESISMESNEKVFIKKVKVIDKKNSGQNIAVVSPKVKKHYSDRKFYMFFFIDEKNYKRYRK